jgi:hypothetical protein
MEFGTVKFFDARPEKRFGFMVVDGRSEEIFFHYNDWNWIVAGKQKPEFDPSFRIAAGPNARPKEPQKGDRIAFHRTLSNHGYKASPWMHESMYQQVTEQIGRRTPEPMYRLMYQPIFFGKPMGNPSVLWSGTDLSDCRLPTHFNPVHQRICFGNSDIYGKKFWEVSGDNGKTWASCDIPTEYKKLFDIRGVYLKRRW